MIVVIGGSGFVGRHLVESLKGDVLVIDRTPPKEDVGFIEADIVEPLPELPKRCKVVHLAALTNAHESDRIKEKYFDVNVRGTFNVVRACEEAKCKKIVFISSVAVYDPNLTGAVTENSPLRPANFYGTTKILGEVLVKNSGIPYAILRPTNIYGKGGHGVINSFIERINAGQPVEIWGTGNQKRDFLHVSDVVNAILLALKKVKGIYNISSGKNTSVNEIVDIIESIMERKINKIYRKVIEKDICHTVSNDKAKRELGFVPSKNLREGVGELL